MSDAEAQPFHQLSSSIDDEWAADMDKRGFAGKKLLESAKALIARHGKG